MEWSLHTGLLQFPHREMLITQAWQYEDPFGTIISVGRFSNIGALYQLTQNFAWTAAPQKSWCPLPLMLAPRVPSHPLPLSFDALYYHLGPKFP
jgi:hypothetical protein